MRQVDRLTSEKYGIPSILLMENAAHAAARVITEKLGGSVKDKSILVLCGKGNNGGDGAALARILWTQGATIWLALFAKLDDTEHDARVNFEAAAMLSTDVFGRPFGNDLVFAECPSSKEWNRFQGKAFSFSEPVAIVDALLGIGLTSPLRTIYKDVATFVRKSQVDYEGRGILVFSLDLPSGLDADKSQRIGEVIEADVTITFTAPKPANVLPPAANLNGNLVVANIGSPPELINDQSQFFLSEAEDAVDWIRFTKFSNDSYKNKRGHSLIIAGSAGYSGAAVLAGNAAMRSGIGLVTIATPKSTKASVASRVLPEVMIRGVAETESGAISESAFNELADLLENADSVAVGSGLSQDESTRAFVNKVVKNRRQPTIVDADALNLLSPFEITKPARSKSTEPDKNREFSLILTPHEGEFLRLLGTNEKDAIKDRVAAVRKFATTHSVILVLKGERVLIGEPGGKVVVNPTGNSGLGKAGNGDTLTGILAGFVAQAVQMNVDIFETVVAAVYVAGMAGDIAEKKYGKRVMTASDVRECLSDAFAALEIKRS